MARIYKRREQGIVSINNNGGNHWIVHVKPKGFSAIGREIFCGTKKQCIEFKKGLNAYEDSKRTYNVKSKWWDWKNKFDTNA